MENTQPVSTASFSPSSRATFNPHEGINMIHDWVRDKATSKAQLEGVRNFVLQILVDDTKHQADRTALSAAIHQLGETPSKQDITPLLPLIAKVANGSENAPGRSYTVGQYQISRALYNIFHNAPKVELMTTVDVTFLRMATLFIQAKHFPEKDIALAQSLATALDDTTAERGKMIQEAVAKLRDHYYESYGPSWLGRQTIGRLTGN